MPFTLFRSALQRLSGITVVVILLMVQTGATANPPDASREKAPTVAAESKSAADTQVQKFAARKKDKSPLRDWTRAAGRPDPDQSVSDRAADFAPRIRFISASGSEEGETAHAVMTDPAEEAAVAADAGDPIPTPSISIREQLLSALKSHREGGTAEAGAEHASGSLTILNSPHTLQNPANLAVAEEPAAHAAAEADLSVPVKTRVGLTRTLEADLKSADPYVRDRAQRYLRLEMQLLKLQANQAAEAEQSPEKPLVQDRPQHADDRARTIPQHTVHAESTISTEPVAANHGHSAASPSAEEGHAAIQHPDVPPSESAAVDAHIDTRPDSGPIQHSASPQAFHLDNIVVDGPIDRLGLANNLFAVGEFPLALEMYRQTDGTGLTSHQYFWVEYQKANCLRRLGKSAEASNGYRRLADQPEAGWLSRQARWWVDLLERIRILEKTLAEHAVAAPATAPEQPKQEELQHVKQSH